MAGELNACKEKGPPMTGLSSVPDGRELIASPANQAGSTEPK